MVYCKRVGSLKPFGRHNTLRRLPTALYLNFGAARVIEVRLKVGEERRREGGRGGLEKEMRL